MISAFSGQIPVCLQCGHRDIRPQGIREGLWPGGGEGVAWVCKACGHIGPPFLMDGEEGPPATDQAWQQEFEATARRLDEEKEAPREGKAIRRLGILFLVVAAIFFVPSITVVTNAIMSGQPGMVSAAIGEAWFFWGIGTVALVLGVRKVDHAARLENKEPTHLGPLAELRKATEEKNR